MKTADKIKALRTRKGLSQEELGKMVGLQKAAINKYETGRVVNIKKSILQKLADALSVSPADLLDDPEGYDTPMGIPSDFFIMQKEEEELLGYFRMLNADGKTQAVSMLKVLSEMKVYKKEPGSSGEVSTA